MTKVVASQTGSVNSVGFEQARNTRLLLELLELI
jgi:hypothetical protein